MVQAFRAGLLKPGYTHKWSSRIREAWLLKSIEQEDDAELGINALHLKSQFAAWMENRQSSLTDMLRRMSLLGRYGEGDPTALLSLNNSSDMKSLQELWQVLRHNGIV